MVYVFVFFAGVVLQEGVSNDCAAAIAILLFGSTDTKLPGGFAGEELSPDSPINKVQEFPQEFVLLGRATVMIKGIANRLGLPWAFSDRWATAALEAIECNHPDQKSPIWSVSQTSVFSPQPSLGTLIAKQRKGERIKLADIVSQVGVLLELIRVRFCTIFFTIILNRCLFRRSLQRKYTSAH